MAESDLIMKYDNLDPQRHSSGVTYPSIKWLLLLFIIAGE